MSIPAPLASFPASVREAHTRWLERQDPDALAHVVIGIVAAHRPGACRSAPDLALPTDARLIEDLGFDSLALAEVVFFIEDLYRVSISNEDIRGISTVGDLRAFVFARIAPPAQPST